MPRCRRQRTRKLGVRSGVGLVAANMIGAGVFLSAGFMAQDMGPGPILLAWVVGAVLALAGARAYAELARLVPRSGGEYRYLSELLHPALGYLSGWASLLVGFSAPVAIDALAAGGFAKTIFPGAGPAVDRRGAHRGPHRAARGRALDERPDAEPPHRREGAAARGLRLRRPRATARAPGPRGGRRTTRRGFPAAAVRPRASSTSRFAFSGWNAAVYAAEEFRDPARTVPRAMMIGTALVAVLYLVVNWIFVANLTPAQASVVFQYKSARVTLGHAVVAALRWARAGRR